MEFKNIDVFRKFIEKNLKMPYGCYDLNACIADFEKKVSETGSYSYELGPYETNSGLPECIYFERVDKFFLDDEEVDPAENDFDYAKTTIIF